MKPSLLLGLCAAALVSAATTTHAQATGTERAERPYRGLFGGGIGETEQLLTVNTSLGAGVGNRLGRGDVTPGELGPVNPPTVRTELIGFGTVSGGLDYSLSRQRISLTGALMTSGRLTPGQDAGYIGAHSGSFGASLGVSRHARLSASHSISYQPYATLFGLSGFSGGLGDLSTPDLNLGVSPSSQIAQSTSVEFTQTIGRNNSIAVNYLGSRYDFSGAGDDMRISSVGARYSHGFSRGLGFHLGYGYMERRLGASLANLTRGHNLDVGVDLDRGLSLTRRTKLMFSTGSSAVSYDNRTRFFITGRAELRREIGRSWNASLSYGRGVSFVERISQPLVSDSLQAGVGGLVSRRVQWQSSVGVTLGSFDIYAGEDGGQGSAQRNADRQRSYTGSSTLSIALTRNLAFGASYSYYRYQFTNPIVVPGGFLPSLTNQSARAYLSLWAPLFQRAARRSDAAR